MANYMILFISILAVLIELGLLIWIGSLIGVWYALLIVVATAFIGITLAQIEGWATIKSLRSDVKSLKMPANEIIDSIMIMVGALLLIIPGFVTDIIGLLFLIPPVRMLFRNIIKSQIKKKIESKLRLLGRF